jgi:hypothetical protein
MGAYKTFRIIATLYFAAQGVVSTYLLYEWADETGTRSKFYAIAGIVRDVGAIIVLNSHRPPAEDRTTADPIIIGLTFFVVGYIVQLFLQIPALAINEVRNYILSFHTPLLVWQFAQMMETFVLLIIAIVVGFVPAVRVKAELFAETYNTYLGYGTEPQIAATTIVAVDPHAPPTSYSQLDP